MAKYYSSNEQNRKMHRSKNGIYIWIEIFDFRGKTTKRTLALDIWQQNEYQNLKMT